MASSFSMSFTVVEPRDQLRRAAHPIDRAGAATPTTPTARRVLQLIAHHRPWQVVDNVAAVIVDQTHAALLEILGPAAPLLDGGGGGGHVEVGRPVDPADPDSPLLCVNASAAHCRVCLVNSHHHGGATSPEHARCASPEQKGKPQYRLARTSVSVSPGTLHLARVDGGGGWKCAEVRPDVKARGVLGVLETIKARLDAAIRVEARLIEMASACGGGSEVGDIVEARAALERMREEVDVGAIMRRRCQKRRRRLVEEISGRPEVGPADEAEALAKSLTELHVSQKRRRRAPEASRQPAGCVAEALAKSLRALHV